MLPVCSAYGDPAVYADHLFPLASDWALATGRYFPGDPARALHSFAALTPSCAWRDKTPQLFFRGSSTGGGSNARTNTRMRLVGLSLRHPETMDCGITSFSRRFKVQAGCVTRDDGDAPALRRLRKPFVPLPQQRRYKYIAVVDGHSAPNRLAALLHFGSVLFIVDSDAQTSGRRMWFSRHLVPMVHYVPVRNDLGNLVEKLRYARSHDAECREMGERCMQVARQLFSAPALAAEAARTLACCAAADPRLTLR
jgi:hypothetical protein